MIAQPQAGEAERWDPDHLSDQTGRVAVVTGANTGIGFEVARTLVSHGAVVVLACRNADKMAAARNRLLDLKPQARIHAVKLDLSDLTSVRLAAEEIKQTHNRVDLLINNAGAAWPPRALTAAGVELQLATNHLGHFALTGLLIEKMGDVPDSRVISMSSLAHHFARIRFDDINYDKRKYLGFFAYGQSKLANLLFMRELQSRLAANGAATRSLAAHPGGSRTELVRAREAAWLGDARVRMLRPLLMFQSAAMGALPALRAALDPNAEGGDYYGPGGIFGLTGPPKPARTSRPSRNAELQRKLWEYSEHVSAIGFL